MKRTFSALNGDVYEYEVNFKEDNIEVTLFFDERLCGYGVLEPNVVSVYKDDWVFLEAYSSNYSDLNTIDESIFKYIAENVVISLRNYRLRNLVEQMDVILNCVNLHTDSL